MRLCLAQPSPGQGTRGPLCHSQGISEQGPQPRAHCMPDGPLLPNPGELWCPSHHSPRALLSGPRPPTGGSAPPLLLCSAVCRPLPTQFHSHSLLGQASGMAALRGPRVRGGPQGWAQPTEQEERPPPTHSAPAAGRASETSQGLQQAHCFPPATPALHHPGQLGTRPVTPDCPDGKAPGGVQGTTLGTGGTGFHAQSLGLPPPGLPEPTGQAARQGPRVAGAGAAPPATPQPRNSRALHLLQRPRSHRVPDPSLPLPFQRQSAPSGPPDDDTERPSRR